MFFSKNKIICQYVKSKLGCNFGYKAKPYRLLSTYYYDTHFKRMSLDVTFCFIKEMYLNFPCATGLNKDDVLCFSLIKTRVRERMISEQYKIIACTCTYSPEIHKSSWYIVKRQGLYPKNLPILI